MGPASVGCVERGLAGKGSGWEQERIVRGTRVGVERSERRMEDVRERWREWEISGDGNEGRVGLQMEGGESRDW